MPSDVVFEWGMAGARAAARHAGVVAVADVLSFTTAAAIATGRGSLVIPCGEEAEARALADASAAVLAARRGAETDEIPWSLSPASLLEGELPARLVLASPNGSAISARLAAEGRTVLGLCLRNVSVAAEWLLARLGAPGEGGIAVIAAGERWDDGSLRPAVEDHLAAGLLLGRLQEAGLELSPEALLAARACTGLGYDEIVRLVEAGASAAELRQVGYAEDVALAAAVDTDGGVPVLIGGELGPGAGFAWWSGGGP